MPRMSSGFIIAGAYANKIRRVMFAMERSVDSKEVARAVAELNSAIFYIVRETGIDKGDVVRITVNYKIEGGKIIWDWDTLELQHYKLIPETSEKAKQLLPRAIEEAKAVLAAPEARREVEVVEEAVPTPALEFSVDYLGSSEEGIEDIYTVKVKVKGEYQLAGVSRVNFESGEGKALVVLVTPEPEKRAYRLSLTIPYVRDPRRAAEILEKEINNAMSEGRAVELEVEQAKKIIRELMQES